MPKQTPERTDLWIISGNSDPVFLETREQVEDTVEIRIPSTDWIHDFAPKLELGESFVVEIPKGEKIIRKAWEYIEEAEESFRKWDTKGVYANCREAGKLLDKTINEKLKGKPSMKKWKRVIEKFNYASSLDLHLEDIKEEKPEGAIIIKKADAEHLLISSKALIKYAENLLQDEK